MTCYFAEMKQSLAKSNSYMILDVSKHVEWRWEAMQEHAWTTCIDVLEKCTLLRVRQISCLSLVVISSSYPQFNLKGVGKGPKRTFGADGNVLSGWLEGSVRGRQGLHWLTTDLAKSEVLRTIAVPIYFESICEKCKPACQKKLTKPLLEPLMDQQNMCSYLLRGSYIYVYHIYIYIYEWASIHILNHDSY